MQVNSVIFRTQPFPFLIWLVLLASFLCLNCGPPPEPLEKSWEKFRNVDLDPKDQTLESLNQILQQEGRKTENPEMNTQAYEWYFGTVRAKFIEEYKSSNQKEYKLVELELHRKSVNFPGSIFGVHLTDPADQIPEILNKTKCKKIEQSQGVGNADCNDKWSVIWFYYQGQLDSFRAYHTGYIKIPIKQ